MTPQLAAEFVSPDRVHPWPGNPRNNAAAVGKVADSIKRFGFASPIVARLENGEIIAGHTRYAAAKKLKLTQIPVRFLDVSERDARLLALADNKLGEIAEWDTAAVAEALSDYGFKDVAFAGWDFEELGKLADSMEPDADLDAKSKLGGDLTYSVIIACGSEDEQTELLERFEAEGLKCKPLVS